MYLCIYMGICSLIFTRYITKEGILLNNIFTYILYLNIIVYFSRKLYKYINQQLIIYNNNNIKVKFINLEINELNIENNIVISQDNNYFTLIVFNVTLLISIFTYSYLFKDKHLSRLYILINIFLLFMILYIISNDIITLFISWEIFGFISGILICYWKNSNNNIMNSIKALIINRIGDYMLTIYIFIQLNLFNDSNYYNIITYLLFTNYDNNYYIPIILLTIAVLSKSAQFPFYTWLYDAMSAPTPISSLLHAATMVTAGSFILIIFKKIIILPIYYFYWLLIFIIFIFFTIYITSMFSYITYDIKKILAFSTSGQLAIITISNLSNIEIYGYYHLLIHAIFKCSFFLAVANIIHSLYDNQDTRKYGYLWINMPITNTILLISGYSMLSYPMFSGYFSKDYILDYLYYIYDKISLISYYSILLGVFFTISYTIKILNKTFNNYYSMEILTFYAIHESSYFTLIPLLLLSIVNIIIPIFNIINFKNFYKYILSAYNNSSYYIYFTLIIVIISLIVSYNISKIGNNNLINNILSNNLKWLHFNIRFSVIILYFALNNLFIYLDKYILIFNINYAINKYKNLSYLICNFYDLIYWLNNLLLVISFIIITIVLLIIIKLISS